MNKNVQEEFWKSSSRQDYIGDNQEFDVNDGIECWKTILKKTTGVSSVLECGCNIGRNINFLNHVLPQASKSVIEINETAINITKSKYAITQSHNGPIVTAPFQPGSFDLVFTIGVLIHIHPDDLLQNMKKMYDLSGRYILMGEYFNRTPTSIEYRGGKDLLFKRDFGKLLLENFPVTLVDYGFLWGHLHDKSGFDDITYWVFSKG